MPALSFTAIEILPSLLNKTKVQTIRPLFEQKPLKAIMKGADRLVQTGDPYKKPRLKVGDIVTMYWHQRSKANFFFKDTGNPVYLGTSLAGKSHKPSNYSFPKLLGKVKITEVFEITMQFRWQDDKEFFIIESEKLMKFSDKYVDLPTRDGFKDEQDFHEYFRKQYHIITDEPAKKFAVYRWEWI